jgi:hypothetical protein
MPRDRSKARHGEKPARREQTLPATSVATHVALAHP